MNASVAALTKGVTGGVAKAKTAADAAANRVTDLQGAVETSVAKIAQTAATDSTVAKVEAAVATIDELNAKSAANAVQLEDAVKQIEPNGKVEEAAKQDLLKALDDHKISAAEQREVAADLVVLSAGLSKGTATTHANLGEMVKFLDQSTALQNSLHTALDSANRTLTSLQANIAKLAADTEQISRNQQALDRRMQTQLPSR